MDEKFNGILLKPISTDECDNLELNHKLVLETLVTCTKMFNQAGVDYYIAGAVPCYLKMGLPLSRHHEDLDIMINENDIPKVYNIITSLGYVFYDDRFPSLERLKQIKVNKPPHLVLAQKKGSDFHIGFFLFKRKENNEIAVRKYSHREENEKVIIDVEERISDSIGVSIRYDNVPTECYGTSFRTETVECIYNIKSYIKRPKDIIDMQILEPYINKDCLNQIRTHRDKSIIYQNIKKI